MILQRTIHAFNPRVLLPSLVLLFVGFLNTASVAQDTGAFFLSGPKGTLISLLFSEQSAKQLRFDPLETVNIYKNSTRNAKKRNLIAQVSFPATAQAFSERLSETSLQALMESKNATSLESLYQLIRSQPLDSLGLDLFSLELQVALGLSYLDETWKIGEAVQYELEKVGANQQLLQAMSHSVTGQTAHYPEKFRLSSHDASDSLVHIAWSGPALMHAKQAFPVFTKLLQKKDLEASYEQVGLGIVIPSTNKDSAQVLYAQEIERGQAYSFYSVLFDWAGNESQPSDTLNTLAISSDEIELITEFRVAQKDNVLALRWNPLRKSAIYTGIELSKSRQPDSGYLVLDTLASQESNYLDRQVLKGSAYYYRIRPLLVLANNARASAYAQTSASLSYPADNPAPKAPEGLRIGRHEKGMQLSWWAPSELDIFGYYVLRGTNEKDLQLIGEIVQDTVYVDEDFPINYSGDIHYAVLAMNQNQQLSDTSSIQSLAIRQSIELPPVSGLASYLSAETVSLRWNDMTEIDDRIVSYLILRRKKGEALYDVLNLKERVMLPFYQDTLGAGLDPHSSYEYAISTQDIWGNRSIPSATSTVDLSKNLLKKLSPPSELYVRNLEEGIEIFWPESYEYGPEKYIIYRKVAGQENFEQLSIVSPTEPYLDATGQTGELYEYCISVLNGKIEGELSPGYTQRR